MTDRVPEGFAGAIIREGTVPDDDAALQLAEVAASDVVMLLHREAYYHVGDKDWEIENEDKLNVAELIIAKQRNGPTGSVKLAFLGQFTRFENLAVDRYTEHFT